MADTHNQAEVKTRYPVIGDPIRTKGIVMNLVAERGSFVSRRMKVGF
jgi:hypothetical protein